MLHIIYMTALKTKYNFTLISSFLVYGIKIVLPRNKEKHFK